jgi:hypothetical protein
MLPSRGICWQKVSSGALLRSVRCLEVYFNMPASRKSRQIFYQNRMECTSRTMGFHVWVLSWQQCCQSLSNWFYCTVESLTNQRWLKSWAFSEATGYRTCLSRLSSTVVYSLVSVRVCFCILCFLKSPRSCFPFILFIFTGLNRSQIGRPDRTECPTYGGGFSGHNSALWLSGAGMLLTISATAWLPSLPGENRHDTTASAAPQESPCLLAFPGPHPHRHCTGNLSWKCGAAPATHMPDVAQSMSM